MFARRSHADRSWLTSFNFSSSYYRLGDDLVAFLSSRFAHMQSSRAVRQPCSTFCIVVEVLHHGRLYNVHVEQLLSHGTKLRLKWGHCSHGTKNANQQEFRLLVLQLNARHSCGTPTPQKRTSPTMFEQFTCKRLGDCAGLPPRCESNCS